MILDLLIKVGLTMPTASELITNSGLNSRPMWIISAGDLTMQAFSSSIINDSTEKGARSWSKAFWKDVKSNCDDPSVSKETTFCKMISDFLAELKESENDIQCINPDDVREINRSTADPVERIRMYDEALDHKFVGDGNIVEDSRCPKKRRKDRMEPLPNSVLDKIICKNTSPTKVQEGLNLINALPPNLSKRQKASRIAQCPVMCKAAEVSCTLASLATKTRASYSSAVNLFSKICSDMGHLTLWPLTPTIVTTFAGILEQCEYVGSSYLSAIKTAAEVAGFPLNTETQTALTRAHGSLNKTSSNEAYHMFPVLMHHLNRLNDVTMGDAKANLQSMLMVICTFWCLRAEEGISLLDSQCIVSEKTIKTGRRERTIYEVELLIDNDKTNKGGRPLKRSLICPCGGKEFSKNVPACPVCCVRKLKLNTKNCRKIDGMKLGRPIATDKFTHAKFLNHIRLMMARLGEPLTDANNKQQFGEHSMRGGGSIMMALKGTDLALIKLWGRWNSDAVLRYVLDIPLLAKAKSFASDIFNMTEDDTFALVNNKLWPEVDDIVNVCLSNDSKEWCMGKVMSSNKASKSWCMDLNYQSIPLTEAGPLYVNVEVTQKVYWVIEKRANTSN